MKVLLILDEMPIGCLDCKLHIGIADFAGMYAGCYCLSTGPTNHDGTKRGAKCPLKETPENKEYNDKNMWNYHRGYVDGWNNCLDDILGTED